MANSISYKVKGLDCVEEILLLKDEVAVLKEAFGHRKGIVQLDFDVLNAKVSLKRIQEISRRTHKLH
jgi:hypothetical protein